MKRLLPLLLAIALVPACSLRQPPSSATVKPSPKAGKGIFDHKDWYYSAERRILSDALTARIRPALPAVVTSESAEDDDCREVQANDPAHDMGTDAMQNEVSLAVSGDRVVVTYNDDNDARVSVSGYTWSADGGRTFTDGGPVLPPGQAFGGGDPLILADPNDPLRFLYIQLTYGGTPQSSMLLHESTDGGMTFPVEQARDLLKGLMGPVQGKPLESPAFFHDKEWASWDGPTDTIVLAWTMFTNTSALPVAIVSTDGGRTWGDGVNLAPANRMGGLCGTAIGPDGTIYVVWNDWNVSCLRVSRSPDGGATWEGPFEAVGTFQAPFDQQATQACGGRTALNGQIRTASIPSMAADPVTGDLYIVYNYKADKGADDDSDIGFVRSSDRGATWSAPVRINDDGTTADQFQPWVATAGGGNLLVMFYDRRDDPSNRDIHVYAAQSFDGGATWLANRRLTCRSFPPAQSSCYMGDYNQVVSDGSRYYLAWGDNRNTTSVGGAERPNPDVFTTSVKAQPRTRPLAKPE